MDTLVSNIYQTLEDDIVNLRILPGAAISENSLCERFEVSRTPIRSALQMLQTQRLVEITARKGTNVTRLHYDLVNQIIYQRVYTEAAILRDYVPTRTPHEVVQLRHHLSLMKTERDRYVAGQTPDFVKFYAADNAMHEVWYRAARKCYLWEYINNCKADYRRFSILDMRYGENYEDVYDMHTELLRVVEEQDIAPIEQLMKRHLNSGIERLGTRVYTDLKEYFDPKSLES